MTLPTTRLPDLVRPASFQIQRHHNVLTSAPIAGKHKMQTRVIGQAYHQIRLKYDPIHRDDFGSLIPFLNNLRAQHDTFGIVLPNYTKGVTGLHAGNYITTTGGKTRQVLDAGNGPNTELLTSLTTAGGNYFTNSLSVTTGNPVGVYFDTSDVPTGTTIELFTSNSGVTGAIASDSFTVNEGRNIHVLTPTTSGTVYVRVSSSVITLKGVSVKGCFLRSSYTTTFAPELTAGHASDFIIPLPVALMNVSLNGPMQKVDYGKNSLIKIELDLIERE